MFDKAVLSCFLEKQSQLFAEPVAETPEEAQDFLEDIFAQVADSKQEVWDYFEEEGMDTAGATPDTIVEAAEVFAVGDGRYLIVEA